MTILLQHNLGFGWGKPTLTTAPTTTVPPTTLPIPTTLPAMTVARRGIRNFGFSMRDSWR